VAIFTNNGLDGKTRYVLGLTLVPPVFTVRLFVNNVVFALTTLTINLTECTLPGYDSVTLDGTNWTGGTAGGLSNYNYPTITWTFTPFAGPAQTIFGYFVTDQGGTTWWGETSSSPFNVPISGGQVTLLPGWLDQNV
jgi:hypothetical protein